MNRDAIIEKLIDHMLRFNRFEDTASKRASLRYIHIDFSDKQLVELLAAWEKRANAKR